MCLSLSCWCIDINRGTSYTTSGVLLMNDLEFLDMRSIVTPNFRATGF